MAHGVEPDALAEALRRAALSGPINAVFIVSPTYYGMSSRCSPAAPRSPRRRRPTRGSTGAWGAHFGFHADLPLSPLQLSADAMLASTHKIVGSMTQSAMLLVADGDRIDVGAVARAVRLLRSTSPNALLLSSLDAARRQLAVHGEALLDRTLRASARARAAIDEIPGCRVVGEAMVGRPGIAGWDPLRIVIDVRGTGLTGYQVASALRASFDIYPELATHATVVLVLGLAQPLDALEQVAHDLGETIRRIAPTIEPDEPPVVMRPPTGGEDATAIPPREAFLGDSEAVPVDQAVGRISCESIAGYPPGIPTLLPGERVTPEVVEYLRELTTAGARLHGAADPTFRTIRVLADARSVAPVGDDDG